MARKPFQDTEGFTIGFLGATSRLANAMVTNLAENYIAHRKLKVKEIQLFWRPDEEETPNDATVKGEALHARCEQIFMDIRRNREIDPLLLIPTLSVKKNLEDMLDCDILVLCADQANKIREDCNLPSDKPMPATFEFTENSRLLSEAEVRRRYDDKDKKWFTSKISGKRRDWQEVLMQHQIFKALYGVHQQCRDKFGHGLDFRVLEFLPYNFGIFANYGKMLKELRERGKAFRGLLIVNTNPIDEGSYILASFTGADPQDRESLLYRIVGNANIDAERFREEIRDIITHTYLPQEDEASKIFRKILIEDIIVDHFIVGTHTDDGQIPVLSGGSVRTSKGDLKLALNRKEIKERIRGGALRRLKSGLNIFEEMSKTLPRVLMRLCDTKLAEEAFLCTEDGPTFKDSANIHFEKLPELSCYFAGRKLDPTLGSFFALVPAVFIHKLGGIDYYRLKPYNTDLQLSEEETGEFTDSLRISRMALEALAKEPQFQFNLLDIRGEEPAFVRTPSPRELLIYPGYYKEQDKQVITLYDFRTRRSRIIPSQGIRLTTVLRSHPQDGPGLAFAALQVKENVADRVLHSIIGVWEEEPHSGGSSWEFQFPYLDLGKEDVYALFGARDGDRYRIVASILQKEPQVAIGLHCKGKEIFRTHFYAEGNALDSCAAFPLESTAGKEWYLLGCADGALYLWKWDTNQRQDYRRKMHLAAEGKLSKLEVQAREEGIVVLVGDERNHKLHILTMDPGSESMEAIQGIEAYRGLFAVHADNRLVAMRSDGHAFVTHRKLGNRYHEEHTQMLDAAFDAVIGIEMDERGTAYVLGPKRCLRVEGAAISSVEPLPYTPFLYGKNYGFAGGRNP